MERVFIIEEEVLKQIESVRTRLNDIRTLKPGEQFDLGDKLDVAINRFIEIDPERIK